MATATSVEPTREQLEQKRDKLLLRKQGLEQAIEEAPAEIAQKRELWVRSESPAAERKLHQAIRAREAAEADLVEVDESIAVVDRLLGEILAREAEARAVEVRVEGDRLAQAQLDAVSAFAEGFATLFSERYQEYAATTAALGSHYAANRHAYGDRPPFVLDPLPVTIRSLLDMCPRLDAIPLQPGRRIGPDVSRIDVAGVDLKLWAIQRIVEIHRRLINVR